LPIIQTIGRGAPLRTGYSTIRRWLGVALPGRYWISTPPSAKKRRWQGGAERIKRQRVINHAGDRQPLRFTAKPAHLMPKDQRIVATSPPHIACQSGARTGRGFAQTPFHRDCPTVAKNGEMDAMIAKFRFRASGAIGAFG